MTIQTPSLDYDSGNSHTLIFKDLHLQLEPVRPDIPFAAILAKWIKAGLDRKACRLALERAMRAQKSEFNDMLSPSEIDRGGVVATRKLLFQSYQGNDEWMWINRRRHERAPLGFAVQATTLGSIAALIRAGAAAPSVEAFKESISSFGDARIERFFCQSKRSDEQTECWPSPDLGPGIYRREHAGLLIDSRTTRVLTDPQVLNAGWTTNGGRFPGESGEIKIDSVLVTHSHPDHWHLPSVLTYAVDEQTPVIVPQVKRATLLAENMHEQLRLAGQNVQDPAWWSTTKIGDISIDILPFFGEQPTREKRLLPPEMRNWGNCYRFNTPEFSAIILADSGIDPEGSMIDAVARNVSERGPVDVVLSECFEFPEGTNLGLPHYAFTLPFSELERLRSDGQRSITLGIDGLLEVFRVSRARYFMPYAHGFSGIGRDPKSAEAKGQSESETVARLRNRNKSPVQIIEWLPGDVALFEKGILKSVQRAGPNKNRRS